MKICYLNVFLLFIISITQIHCQTHNFEAHSPEINIPNVASFQKYGDIPVSEYTGVPDISIPLYIIRDGGVEIPITLRYHGSGLRVEEEASWVGLGWNLDVGGVVTRRINGAIDMPLDFKDYYFKPPIDQLYFWPKETEEERFDLYTGVYYSDDHLMVNEGTFPDLFWLLTPMDGGLCPWSIFFEPAIWQKFQPDLYSYSIPGQTGSFYIKYASHLNSKATALILNQRNIVEISTSPNENAIDPSVQNYFWYITDEQGTKYFFEEFQPFSDGIYTNCNSYLTKIRYPNGEIVNFTYTYGSEVIVKRNSMSFAYNENGDLVSIPSYSEYTPVYPKSIETPNFVVNFITNDSFRKDISGECCLDHIEVFAKDEPTKKRVINFDYSHFIAINQDANNTYGTTSTEDHNRLKLISVQESGSEPYVFEYNSTPLPPKNSFSQDYWGYYNGQLNQSLFPKLTLLAEYNQGVLADMPSSYHDWGDANRRASIEYMKACVLEKIIYPTKGYTTFNFEPHTFDNIYYQGVDKTLFNFNDVNNNSITNESITLRVEKSQESKYIYFNVPPLMNQKVKMTINPSISVYTTLGDTERLTELQTRTSIYLHKNYAAFKSYSFESVNAWPFEKKNDTFELEEGYYILCISLPELSTEEENYSSVSVTFNIEAYEKNEYSYGGGLRIKDIKSYTSDGLKNHTEYVYEEFGNSFGRLMIPLDYFSSKNVIQNEILTTQSIRFTSSSFYSLRNDNSSTIVGYDKVVIKQKGPSGESNGKKIKHFTNVIPLKWDENTPVISYWGNGLMHLEEFYNNSNNLIKSIDYDYNNRSDYYFGAIGESFYPTIHAPDCEINSSEIACMVKFYPITSNFIQTILITETDYFVTGDFIKQKTFGFNDIGQINLISENTSLDDTNETYITYPSDDNSGDATIDLMKSYHCLSPHLKLERKLNGLTTYSEEILYASRNFNDGYSFLPCTLKIAPSGMDINQEIYMNYYSNKAKLISQNKTSDISTLYHWGHNDTRLLAKIVNLTQSEIQQYPDVINKLNELDDIDIDAKLESINSYIRNNLPVKCLITTYTYSLMKGISSITDTNGQTTYYEYDDLGRLIFVKDFENNVLKRYNYHYSEQ